MFSVVVIGFVAWLLMSTGTQDFTIEKIIVSDVLTVIIRNKSGHTLYNVAVGLLYAGKEGVSPWINEEIHYGKIQGWETNTTQTLFFLDISLAFTIEYIERSTMRIEYYKNNEYTVTEMSLKGILIEYR